MSLLNFREEKIFKCSFVFTEDEIKIIEMRKDKIGKCLSYHRKKNFSDFFIDKKSFSKDKFIIF